ncbi:MAG: hypothetical protein R3E68_05360 [Burkholderiaceae bacterium]
MHAFEALHVDGHAIDDELCDAGSVGPELAHLAQTYCLSARALVYRQPSSEWRLFIVLLPLASRLSLMTNPIFTQLVRAWGLNLRFIGVDRLGQVYDFRNLLSDRMLATLIEWLRSEDLRHHGAAQPPADVALDILFATLARDMMTVLDKRTDDWGRHLDSRHRLEPGAPASLFDRASRFPDFLRACHEALRNQTIDVDFYGRVLRSIDLREQTLEQRAADQIENCLDPVTIAKLERAGIGKHLGCYNWLRLAPRHAPMRAHILTRLPSFASFFAEALLPMETWQPMAGDIEQLYSEHPTEEELLIQEQQDRETPSRHPVRDAPGYDLGEMASGSLSMRNVEHMMRLRRAVDSGQDRAVIQALAARFSVSENTIRLLWHDKPAALGQPPTWHLAEILRQLDALERRDWPDSRPAWESLMAQAVPAAAA